MAIFSTLWAAITRYSLMDVVTIVGGGLAVTAVGAFVFGIVGDIRQSGAAKAQIACVENVNKSNDDAFQQLAEANARQAKAAQAERDRIKAQAAADADAKDARILALEKLFEFQPVPDQCGYSADMTKALRR